MLERGVNGAHEVDLVRDIFAGAASTGDEKDVERARDRPTTAGGVGGEVCGGSGEVVG